MNPSFVIRGTDPFLQRILHSIVAAYEECSFEHFKHAEDVGEIQKLAESEPGKLKELVEKL